MIMKPISDHRMGQIIAMLAVPALLLLGGSTAFEWRARHLADIPAGHVVRSDSGRPYIKPTGPFDNRTTITWRQFNIYQENRRVARMLSLAGMPFIPSWCC